MGLIPENIIAEIRDRTDIAAVIGEHVPLRRAGANYQGLCPFHQEKSPSFSVSVAKQFFYCFGCQKSGDVFRFLMDLEGRSFVEVAHDLAKRAGVTIPETQSSPHDRRERQAAKTPDSERARLLRLNELCTRFFEEYLKRSEAAQRYLDERGISSEIRARFRIGYAPEQWDALLRVFHHKSVPHELAEQSGMLIRREGAPALPKGAPGTPSTHYDRFRDRVIFPLLVPAGGSGAGASVSGDVVAFGGRTLPHPGKESEKGAKYINSPETPIYKKGEQLYGLHAARDAILKRKQVVIVEGNFDVLALHQHGLDNTVAPMGTALTEVQVRLLARLLGPEGHVVLMLDGDRAGRRATLKDIFLLSQQDLHDVALFVGRDLDVRVAPLPDGEDPDTFAKRDPEGLHRLVQNSRPAIDYVLDEALAQSEHQSLGGRAKIVDRLLPLLKAVRNPTARELYIDRLASALEVRPELLLRKLEGPAAQPDPGRSAQAQGGPPGRSYDPSGRSYDPAGRSYDPAGRSHESRGRSYDAQGRSQDPRGRSYDSQGHSMPSPQGPSYGAAAGPPARMGNVRQNTEQATAPRSGRPAMDPQALHLIALCADHPMLAATLRDDVLDSVDSPVISELLRAFRDQVKTGTETSTADLVALAPPEARSEVAAAALSGRFLHSEKPEVELERVSREIRASALKREVLDLKRALLRTMTAGEDASRQQILRRMQELTERRAQLLAGAQEPSTTAPTPRPSHMSADAFGSDDAVQGDPLQ